jgi:outer membrane receptor protein involved in Fe transport
LKRFLSFTLVILSLNSFAQTPQGIISGNVLDEKKLAIMGASVQLYSLTDSLYKRTTLTDKAGEFSFSSLAFGWYRIRITSISFSPLVLDSIHVRAERFDFSLNDLTLNQSASQMEEVIVYAEKPLIQSKDGNITFNASESPLSAGSNANELLKNVPLVTTDPDGKVLVKGKEPKILIDDKPVQLNQQQLQDLLESMSGSSIEKIEVMTNPPPQYAMEQGGVINIVTRKGRVGLTGRVSVSAGTRGEGTVNGYFSLRKKGFSITFNTGAGYNQFKGNSYSKRENIYPDSINHFNTESEYQNRSLRPNARLNMDYEMDKRNAVNVVFQFNQNIFRNKSLTQYTNLNQYDEIYKLSERSIRSEGESANPNLSLTYTHKGKQPGETLQLIANANYSYNQTDRYFFQEFLNPVDESKTGVDSTQQQLNDTWNLGYSLRLNYDKMLRNKRTFVSTGGYFNRSSSHVVLESSYLKKPDSIMVKSDLLSNDFNFTQDVSNLRFSVKQVFTTGFSAVAGLNAELTEIQFDLYETNSKIFNNYWSWLPFANINRTWVNKLSLSLAYRRTIRRPGIWELNPNVDYGDPYNLRFGNPYLLPSLAHNFDLVLGKTKDKFYANIGLGFNMVEDIYSQLRTLLPDGKTQITWENISNRNEYEISGWTGYAVSKQWRWNFSATYTYNQYSLHDRTVNKFRNGGSIGTNLNSTYSPNDVFNVVGSFTFNRFANPQGSVKSTLSMNIGIQ